MVQRRLHTQTFVMQTTAFYGPHACPPPPLRAVLLRYLRGACNPPALPLINAWSVTTSTGGVYEQNGRCCNRAAMTRGKTHRDDVTPLVNIARSVTPHSASCYPACHPFLRTTPADTTPTHRPHRTARLRLPRALRTAMRYVTTTRCIETLFRMNYLTTVRGG